MPGESPTPSRSPSLSTVDGGADSSRSGSIDLSNVSSTRSRLRNGTEWECVEVLRAGPNPRWRCKSCLTDYTGAPRRIAQHILGAGGVGQIKPCPRPLQEYVTLMTDLMALDAESGRLVKKARFGEEGGGGGGSGSGGGGGIGAAPAMSPAKTPGRRKQRSGGGSASSSSGSQPPSPPSPALFEVFVAKEDFKFSSSHFVAFDGFRERLHGHNYSCSVRMRGEVCEDGYVVDFGVVKKAMRKLCKEMNERFLCPMESDALKITLTGSQVVIVCQDGATFVLPRDDCALLPLVHSTAEELAHHLFARLLREFGLSYLHARGVRDLEVSVAELPRQEAVYRGKVPLTEDMIRDPPFKGARRVQGCFSHDDGDFSTSGGGSSSNVLHYSSGGAGGSGSSGSGGNGGGGGGNSRAGGNNNGTGGIVSSNTNGLAGGTGVSSGNSAGGGGGGGGGGASTGLSNSNHLHPPPYPYGVLLGDNAWGSGSSGGNGGDGGSTSGGRMRLGDGGGVGAGVGLDVPTSGGGMALLPGLRPNMGVLSGSHGFSPGHVGGNGGGGGGGGGGGFGLGPELPLGAPRSRGM